MVPEGSRFKATGKSVLIRVQVTARRTSSGSRPSRGHGNNDSRWNLRFKCRRLEQSRGSFPSLPRDERPRFTCQRRASLTVAQTPRPFSFSPFLCLPLKAHRRDVPDVPAHRLRQQPNVSRRQRHCGRC